VTDAEWDALGAAAWEVRESAHAHGPTRVGAAVRSAAGSIYVGCNVEHRYRSHDVHAEVNALTTMVAGGGSPAVAVLVAAERDRFTPCGSCLDWIFELGGPDCLVAFQGKPGGRVEILAARELMPHYPQ
jgi:cytidine deaminase